MHLDLFPERFFAWHFQVGRMTGWKVAVMRKRMELNRWRHQVQKKTPIKQILWGRKETWGWQQATQTGISPPVCAYKHVLTLTAECPVALITQRKKYHQCNYFPFLTSCHFFPASVFLGKMEPCRSKQDQLCKGLYKDKLKSSVWPFYSLFSSLGVDLILAGR